MSVQPEGVSNLKLSALPDEEFFTDYNDGNYDYNAVNSYRTIDNLGHADAPDGGNGSDMMMSASGPGKTFTTSERTFPYTFAFGVPSNGYPSSPVEVNLTGEDLAELFSETEGADSGLSNADLNRALVTQVRITGKTLDKNSKYALQLFDNSSPPKPLYTQNGYKAWDSAVWRKFGFPMFTSNSTGGRVYRQPAQISQDLKRYGNIKTSDITDGVVHLSYPASRMGGHPAPPDMALVPKAGNGPYFVWALEVVNKEVEDLLTSELFQDPNNVSNFRITKNMYDQVVDAYENKILEVQSKFHNLSKITARLVPLQQQHREHERDAGSEDMNTEYITLEFTAQMTDTK